MDVFWHSQAEQNGWHFADNIFKCIYLAKTLWILIESSLKFVPKGPIDNKSALVLSR